MVTGSQRENHNTKSNVGKTKTKHFKQVKAYSSCSQSEAVRISIIALCLLMCRSQEMVVLPLYLWNTRMNIRVDVDCCHWGWRNALTRLWNVFIIWRQIHWLLSALWWRCRCPLASIHHHIQHLTHVQTSIHHRPLTMKIEVATNPDLPLGKYFKSIY